ncbi:MAG: molybdopterin dinucleotide binding domain-containing protein, partial [Acidimicrobiia bacterium]
VDDHSEGWGDFKDHVEGLEWDTIVARSGVERETIARIGDLYLSANRAVFAWAMGITHHAHGVRNVQAIANLAMTRGMLGRPGCGLLPIRGHSNVQGMGSVGVKPQLKKAVLEALETRLGVVAPRSEGLDTMGCIIAAFNGDLKVGVCLGGNLFGSNPDSDFAARALQRLELVAYLSTTLNTGHVLGRGKETIVLPVLARDEEPEPTTQESMFNFVRLSDGGPARHSGPRSEVSVIADIGEALDARGILDWESMRRHGTIRQAIAEVIPGYEAIGDIDRTRQEFHITGRTFHRPRFATENGRAVFHVVDLPENIVDDGRLRLMTVRSEGQFNTVVYEEEDLYRGQMRRDVIMLNAEDLARLRLVEDQPVVVRSETGEMTGITVRAIDIRPGNCVMYYPEANVLVPRTVDPLSQTPGFKDAVISVEPVPTADRPPQ